MKVFMLLLLSAISSSAFATVETDVLFPLQNQRPFFALSPKDKQLPTTQHVGIILQRARSVCEFYGLPRGNFSSRSAKKIITNIFDHNGTIVQLDKSQGRWKAKFIQLPDSAEAEIIKSLVCVGN